MDGGDTAAREQIVHPIRAGLVLSFPAPRVVLMVEVVMMVVVVMVMGRRGGNGHAGGPRGLPSFLLLLLQLLSLH